MILGVVICYLLGCVIGTLIFIGIASHICRKDLEFYEFVAEANAAFERGEL